MRANAPRRPTHTGSDRPVRHELADHATLILRRSTTPATTSASGAHRDGATRAITLMGPGHPTNSDKQLSAGMTATLFAEPQERVAVDLVADIVRGAWTSAGRASPVGRSSPQ
jgi:hypothetical protein